MKLFDLLKSLDAGAAAAPDHAAERARVLGELQALLELLAPPSATAPDAAAPGAAPLLDLATIFDGEPDDATAPPAPPRQRVRALLDELAPLLERALGERRDDDTTARP